MDLSIHHSRTLLYTAPNTQENVKLKEVKILHGRLLHIIISVLNIAYEKEVGARILYRNLSGKGIMAHLKAAYVRSEKNPDGMDIKNFYTFFFLSIIYYFIVIIIPKYDNSY